VGLSFFLSFFSGQEAGPINVSLETVCSAEQPDATAPIPFSHMPDLGLHTSHGRTRLLSPHSTMTSFSPRRSDVRTISFSYDGDFIAVAGKDFFIDVVRFTHPFFFLYNCVGTLSLSEGVITEQQHACSLTTTNSCPRGSG
jgi:WD40 repeat protein